MAALAYGTSVKIDKEKNVLIYDLGLYHQFMRFFLKVK